MAKYSLNSGYFDHLTTPEQAYMLGFLWADGHVRKDGYAVAIKVNKRDRDIVEYVRRQLESDHVIADTSEDRVIISFNSQKLNLALRSLGFSSRKTYEDLVPAYGEYDLAFIRGLIDGDGSIWFSRNNWSMQVTGNMSICNFIYNYFGRGGIYRDGSVSKWQVGGRKQIKDIAQELLSCPGQLPSGRKVKLLKEICNG